VGSHSSLFEPQTRPTNKKSSQTSLKTSGILLYYAMAGKKPLCTSLLGEKMMSVGPEVENVMDSQAKILHVSINSRTHAQAKANAALNGLPLSAVVELALRSWLTNSKTGGNVE